MESLHVLVVQDAAEDASVVRGMLMQARGSAWRVSAAHDVPSALAAIAALRPDVVLVALPLQETETASTVRILCDAAGDIAVVVLTSWANDGFWEAAVQAGAQDILTRERVDAELMTRALRHAVERKRFDAALRQSREDLRNAVDLAPHGMLRTTPAGQILFANRTAAAILGYATAGDLVAAVGDDVTVLYAVPERHRELQTRLEAQDHFADADVELRSRDGSALWVRTSARVSRGVDGSVRWYDSTLLDVTAVRRVEEALLETSRRLAAIFENALDAILLADDTTRFVDANPAACRLLGYTPEELRKLCVADVFAADQRAAAAEDWALFRERGTLTGEYRLLACNGSIRHVEVRAVADIRPHLHLAVMHDVSERLETAERLRCRERQLQDAELVAHLGSWDRDLETDEVTASDQMLRIFGFDPEAPLPHTTEYMARIHPADRPRVLALNDAAIRRSGALRYDARILLDDGSVRVVRVTGDLLDDGSAHPRLVGVTQDITERRVDAESMARLDAHLALLLDFSPVVLYTARLDGRYTLDYLSGAVAALTGFSVEEFLRDPDLWVERVHPEDRAAALAAVRRAAEDGQGEHEYRWRVRDGTYRWFHSRRRAVPTPAGGHLITGMWHDVTARRADEDARRGVLRRSLGILEAERQRVARELHDGARQGLAALLVRLRVQSEAGSVAEVRHAARHHVQIVVGIMEELGDLSRGLHPTIVEDLGIVMAIRAHAQEQAQTFSFRCELDLHDADYARLGPEARINIYRIVQETLVNAGRHAAAREVRISLQARDDDGVQLEVRDDGRGFDVGAVLASAAVAGHLGLHGIRERAALLGGAAVVHSAPGGTTIRVTVPFPPARRSAP